MCFKDTCKHFFTRCAAAEASGNAASISESSAIVGYANFVPIEETFLQFGEAFLSGFEVGIFQQRGKQQLLQHFSIRRGSMLVMLLKNLVDLPNKEARLGVLMNALKKFNAVCKHRGNGLQRGFADFNSRR